MFPALAIGAGVSWLFHREVLNRTPPQHEAAPRPQGAIPGPPQLDGNIEPTTRAGVLNLLQGGTPEQLDAAAQSLLRSGYPMAAHACMQRCRQLAHALMQRQQMAQQRQAALEQQAAQNKDVQGLAEAAAAIKAAAGGAAPHPQQTPAAAAAPPPAKDDDTGTPQSSAPPEDRPKVPSVTTRRRASAAKKSGAGARPVAPVAASSSANGHAAPPPSGVDLAGDHLDDQDHVNGHGPAREAH